MSKSKSIKKKKKKTNTPSRRKSSRLNLRVSVLVILIISSLALAGVFYFSNSFQKPADGSNLSEAFEYQVGDPGPGTKAPAFQLPSTAGTNFNLSAFQGQTVLLYFQEGVMCQPCWDQLKEIEMNMDQFKALGIDQIATITTDPPDILKQKTELEDLTTPVLSDQSVKVSETYTTNRYGMMGSRYNGHTFIVVGPKGIIKWRADYGGSPNYTMYLPLANLIADMKQGLGKE